MDLIWKAMRLDIFDLAFEFSSEHLNLLAQPPAGLPRKGVLKRMAIFFWHLLCEVISAMRREPLPASGAFMFFAVSKNERDSLATIVSRVPGACLVGKNGQSSVGFPWASSYLISCFFFPLVLMRYIAARGYRRRAFSYVFDHFWLIYGLYIVSRRWLRRCKPRAVVLANQLSMPHRVVMKAAREERIPTFYVQHASTADRFPPLVVDFALLEGRDALNKLVRAGTTEPRVFLIGMPKLDDHVPHLNCKATVEIVGVCTNGLDPIERADLLCARLRGEFPSIPMILRPHNADRRGKEWRELSSRYGMEYSDSGTELSFNFLKRVDAIISGESNILLEAALLDVYPIYFDFPLSALDWYGFRRSGLVEYRTEPQEVIDQIRELSRLKPSVRCRAGLYCATVGTNYDGFSGALAGALVLALTRLRGDIPKGWKRIPEVGLEAYELDSKLVPAS